MVANILSGLAIIIAVAVAVVGKVMYQRRSPEERESTLIDSSAKIIKLVNEQLEKCEKMKAEMMAQIDRHLVQLNEQEHRIEKLETEVSRLGGDPSVVPHST